MNRSKVLLLSALLLAGCAVGDGSRPVAQSPIPGVTAGSALSIGVSNGTTLAVAVVVNGTTIETVPPGGNEPGIPAIALPPLPWQVEARSPSGRILVSMTVHEGDVVSGSDFAQGVGGRADLSCGRLDIWSGPPMIGPAPGTGSPGDCLP